MIAGQAQPARETNNSRSQDFLSEFCSPSLTADLKFLIPSPSPLPKSANLLGPKINSATARINRISGKPNFPGMSCLPWDTRGALGRRLSLASKFRLVTGGSQKTVVGPWSLTDNGCWPTENKRQTLASGLICLPTFAPKIPATFSGGTSLDKPGPSRRAG
jgi:hypothetical protein